MKTLERRIAEVKFNAVSRYCVEHPDSWMAKKIVGPDPVLWRVMNTDPYAVNWVSRHGDRRSGRLPANYKSGVGVEIPNEPLDKAVERLGANRRHLEVVKAVAFRAGSLVVATEIPAPLTDNSPARLAVEGCTTVIMKVGKDPLTVAAGAMVPETGEFMSTEQLPVVTQAMDLQYARDMYLQGVPIL